jgi:glutaredoxin
MQNKKSILIVILVLVLIGGGFFIWKSNNSKIENSATDVKKSESSKSVSANEKVAPTEEKTLREKMETENSFADLSGTKIIYYYSNSCSHCKAVLEFMDKNDIYTKVEFIKKEISRDRNNSRELSEAATKCGKNPASIGVPFVYDNGKCYMGDTDIIDLFSERAGISK